MAFNEIRNKVRNLDIEEGHKSVRAIETTLCTYNKTYTEDDTSGFTRSDSVKRFSD